jgi:Ankyrin repeats (many copies)
MDYLNELIVYIEEHSVEGIRECLSEGVDPNAHFKGVPLIYELTSEYTRSPQFKDCVQAFVDHGLEFEDKILLSVLLNDAKSLEGYLSNNPEAVSKKYTLRCAYTPLYEATLLHICAEFNHVSCAEMLVKHGADINARAGIDENGFGGQTPIFHTVNQNLNQSFDMLNFLLQQSADLKITVPGLIWGKGYEWETLIPAGNPISYAMMGLLPQMHRNEMTVSKVVSLLLKAAYGIDYSFPNVPCAYLKK